MTPSVQLTDALLAAAAQASRRAASNLLDKQHREGYWWFDLTADSTLESDWILTQLWLYPPVNGVWNPPNRPLVDKAVRSIVKKQLPDGGFNIYEDGPSEISASVKAYFALKLAGIPASDECMQRCRDRILELGGIQAANSYVKINLNLFDLYPRSGVPTVPPELILLGNVIYEMSSWTRAIVIPMSIVQSFNPRKPVPAGFDLKELFKPGVPVNFTNGSFFSWRNLFLTVDRLFKFWEKSGGTSSLRRKALKRCEEWVLQRTRYSDGLGAIYPSMMYTIMALDLLGYAPDHPDRKEAEQQFANLMVERDNDLYFQPCFSVVWDTAIVAFALGEAGAAPPEAMRRCGDWLLSKEVRRKGDWAVKRPNLDPSGWYFEFANEFYPDIDDTAMVLLALANTGASDDHALEAAKKRAVNWLIGMQGRDGGWAAFDVDNDWHLLNHVPFADHNAMLDPACPDITGRVLEALIRMGVDRNHPAIRNGVEYLRRTQEPDGSWYGRWGVNYIYGTFLALRGLRAAGEDDREAYILRAGEWLRSIQNADGGWGESCASYDGQGFRPAPSTPSQTAWAMLGLIAGGDTTSISLNKGAEFLVESQRKDGGWEERLFTGTGFPRVFYLSYHQYRDSFPLLALANFVKAKATD